MTYLELLKTRGIKPLRLSVAKMKCYFRSFFSPENLGLQAYFLFHCFLPLGNAVYFIFHNHTNFCGFVVNVAVR